MADEYRVGDILLRLETVATDSLSGLEKVTASLERLSRPLKQISKISLDNFSNSFKSLSKVNFDNLTKGLEAVKDLDRKSFSGILSLNNNLKKIGELDLSKVSSNLLQIGNLEFSGLKTSFEALNNIDTQKLQSMSRALVKIQNINLDKIDFEKLKSQFAQLTETVTPFLNKLESSKDVLVKFSNAIDLAKVNQQLQKINNSTSKISSNAKSINTATTGTRLNFGKMVSYFGRITVFLNYTTRLRRSLVNTIDLAVDYNETLNKFQVSMGSYYSEAISFVNDLTNAFNLSTESIMNYQATFKNMLDSLGKLSERTSYKLSEALTRMAIDYSSLFNVSIEKAMEQFQSVLAGQTKSIRTASGYDVTESTLLDIYKGLGGTKTVRQLDQLEKRLLRILALQKQMEETTAVNDFARTINNTANVMKQIEQTIKEIGQWVGQIALFYFEDLFIKTQGVFASIREIVKSLAYAKGYTLEIQGGFIGAKESVEETLDAVESLKKTLLGFDQINILGSTSTSNATSTSDYDFLLNAINKDYGENLSNIKNKANEITESILKWLGYTKNITIETDSLGNKIETIKWDLQVGSNLEKILNVVKAISITLGTVLITKKALKLGNTIVGISKLSSSLANITKSIIDFTKHSKMFGFSNTVKLFNIKGLGLGTTVAIFTLLYTRSEEFRDSINKLGRTIGNLIKPVLKFVGTILKAAIPLIDKIIQLVGKSLAPIIEHIANIINILSPFISFDLELIVSSITIIYNVLKPIFTILGAIVEKLLPSLKRYLSSITWVIYGLFNIIGKLANFVIGIWEKITNGIGRVIGRIGKIFGKDWGFSVDIPKVEMPELANGGVVSKPTSVIVGEYANAKNNPEIISPENKMREIFLDSMLPIVQAIVSGDERVVNAIKEGNNQTIVINGRKVSESIYNDLQEVARRKGNKVRYV